MYVLCIDALFIDWEMLVPPTPVVLLSEDIMSELSLDNAAYLLRKSEYAKLFWFTYISVNCCFFMWNFE